MLYGRRADEGNHVDAPKLLQVELQPEDGQEKRNADLGQSLDVVNLGDRHAVGMRPNENAGNDVTEDEQADAGAGRESRR
jgi:hypothetical protein